MSLLVSTTYGRDFDGTLQVLHLQSTDRELAVQLSRREIHSVPITASEDAKHNFV